jgi:hypothetical protein
MKVCSEMRLCTVLPKPKDGNPPIPGLDPPRKVWVCEECSEGRYIDVSSLKRHAQTVHQNKKPTTKQKYAQSLYKKGNYFLVSEPSAALNDPGSDDFLEQTVASFEQWVTEEKEAKTAEVMTRPEDNRLIHPFLLREGWLEEVDQCSSVQLFALVAAPSKDDPLHSLRDRVYEYVRHAQQLVHKTDYLAQNIIMSMDGKPW